MVNKSLIKLLVGSGVGIGFIILSGIFVGGILFSEFIPVYNIASTFMILGLPYGFIAGVLYALFAKIKKPEGNFLKDGFLFGIGFWLSFSILYIIGYLAFSNLGF